MLAKCSNAGDGDETLHKPDQFFMLILLCVVGLLVIIRSIDVAGVIGRSRVMGIVNANRMNYAIRDRAHDCGGNLLGGNPFRER